MQQFFLFSTCFLGLIFSPTAKVVLGKAYTRLEEERKPSSSSSSSASSSSSPSPPVLVIEQPRAQPLKPPPPQSLAQVQNDAVNYHSMSMADICASFTNGSHSEFYSPLYPSNYANNTDCFKIISAGPGQVIRIKFLDHFHIEQEENCDYDFLEIRDGQFGYSTLIQKICGSSPPTFIQSSGRHLWLRFHSDSDIQYIGFKAGFEFISGPFKPDLDECALLSTTFEGNIGTENISQEIVSNARAYEAPVDCTWMIQAEDSQKIYIVFEKYELEKPNDCTYNFIEIYGSQTELTKDSRLKQYCGSKAEAITSKSSILYIRFFSMMDKKGAKELKSKFHAYYNFLRDSTVNNPCNKAEEVDCSDNTCIPIALKCNKKNNCKLRVDEENCPPPPSTDKRYDIAVIASIGCLLIVGMCGGLFLNIFRKIRQDRAELLEIKEALKTTESMLAMQMNPGLAPHGPSPPISSSQDSSGESRDTVLERPLPPSSSGAAGPNGSTINGGNGGQKIRPNGEVKKQLRVQAEVLANTIPYSPPPPYNVQLATSPRFSLKNRSSDIRKELPPTEEKGKKLEPDDEVCIEVRDSACQTRDSYLGQLSSHRQSRNVPLAKQEAFELSDLMPTKRMPRMPTMKPSDGFPSHVSVSSTTSSTGTDRMEASLGSLENIDEYHE